MPFDPNIHHRRSIRLQGYDYTQAGAYFITICTANRQSVFGSVALDKRNLSQRGLMVMESWLDIPNHHPHVELDEFVVMPNHAHGILCITDERTPPPSCVPVGPNVPASRSLGAIVGSFKSAVSRKINRLRPGAAQGLWQANYFEHIIRNDFSLNAIREYIYTNPQRWLLDRENPLGDGSDDFTAFVRRLDVAPSPGRGDAGVDPTEGLR